MISLTEKELQAIREKSDRDPRYLENILRITEEFRQKLYIQKTGRATWSHYYLCPTHGVALRYDPFDPKHYECPIDGEIFTGEPYEGGWWCYKISRTCAGCYALAVGYRISGRQDLLDTAKEILLGYATYFPTYELHGGIPYNEPGKLSSQILTDAAYLNDLACAYDLIRDTFTADECRMIENDLFTLGAAHLQEHFTPQLHNHEVCISAAIGITGLILDRPDLVRHATDAPYGLKYQLDHGVLEDGLWYEGSSGYHCYALRWFLSFEKFARHTEYRLLAVPRYRQILQTMLTYFTRILQSDLLIPALNDGSDAGSFAGKEYLYEFGYTAFPDDRDMLWALHQSVDGTPRDGIESLLYGTEQLPPCPTHTFSNYLSPVGSQFAILHGADKRYLLFKGLPFGGEHDHYDRLSYSFNGFGKRMCSDLGTAKGYGAPLHYAYFKNTATHNTVAINGDNMPPAKTHVRAYRQTAADDVYLDAEVIWDGEVEMPDMFVIRQWTDESYAGVRMRRIIRWFDAYFVDVFLVDAPNDLAKDWILHVDGVRISQASEDAPRDRLSDRDPMRHLHDVFTTCRGGVITHRYDCGDDVLLDVHAYAEGKETIFALGPDNPSVKDISYLIQRTYDKKTVYVNTIEAHKRGAARIQSVAVHPSDEAIRLTITHTDQTTRQIDLPIA